MAYSDSGGIEIVWAHKNDAFMLSNKVKPHLLNRVSKLCYGDPKQRRDNTIIEGDNLQVMASLHKYLGAIDLIYLDPPYNTGSRDFRYNDRWLTNPDETDSGDVVKADDESRHTKWLNFMTPRLMMMKRLLKRTGVIAISIDERELFRLGMLMDAIFDEENRIGIINWQKKYAPSNDSKHLSPTTEYVLVYAAWDKNIAKTGALERTDSMDSKYKNPDNDPEGLWRISDATAKTYSKKADFGIQSPFTGVIHYPAPRSWNNKKSDLKKWLTEWGSDYIELKDPNCPSPSLVLKGSVLQGGKIVTPKNVLHDAIRRAENLAEKRVLPTLYFGKNGRGVPSIKRHLNKVKQGRVPMTFWEEDEYLTPLEIGSQSWVHSESGHNDAAKKLLAQVVGEAHGFDTPKPLMLIEKIIQLWCPPNGIVLDPFAGSGTTAHAVLSLNKKTKSQRRFILIESGDKKSKDLFSRTLTADRVRRVIEGKWKKPVGKAAPLPLGGGFNFLAADGKLDREAILAMEREDMIDLICHADLNDENSLGFLERVNGKYTYLIAKNRRNQGVCLLWNGKDGESKVTKQVCDKARAEIKAAGLNLPLVIYAKQNVYQIDTISFKKIPDEILDQLGMREN